MKDWPKAAARSSMVHEALSRDPEIHAAVRAFCGFGRDVPAEILDDDFLEELDRTIRLVGDGHKAGLMVKEATPKKDRAVIRAVLMNLSKMRREGGYPWVS